MTKDRCQRCGAAFWLYEGELVCSMCARPNVAPIPPQGLSLLRSGSRKKRERL